MGKGQVTGKYVLTISKHCDTAHAYHPAANLLPEGVPSRGKTPFFLLAVLIVGCVGGAVGMVIHRTIHCQGITGDSQEVQINPISCSIQFLFLQGEEKASRR